MCVFVLVTLSFPLTILMTISQIPPLATPQFKVSVYNFLQNHGVPIGLKEEGKMCFIN